MLEYACRVWHPHTAQNINTLESVQRRAVIGQPTASGMQYLIVGANHLRTASRSYIGLPSQNAIIITLSVMYMIVYTTEILYLFMTITVYLKLQPDLIL